jgi:hypothetical protein
METQKLTQEEIHWMKENMNEVVSELRFKSELVKNFYQELEEYRERKDRIGYSLKFKELLKKEEDKLNGRKNK